MQLNVTQALKIADMLHRETQSQPPPPPPQWLIRAATDIVQWQGLPRKSKALGCRPYSQH